MFNKLQQGKDLIKLRQQAKQLQKQLEEIELTEEKGDIRVRVNGAQQVVYLEEGWSYLGVGAQIVSIIQEEAFGCPVPDNPVSEQRFIVRVFEERKFLIQIQFPVVKDQVILFSEVKSKGPVNQQAQPVIGLVGNNSHQAEVLINGHIKKCGVVIQWNYSPFHAFASKDFFRSFTIASGWMPTKS